MTHTEKLFLPIYIKEKEYKPQAVPDYGEGVNRQVDGRGKLEQTRKTVSYKAAIIACLREREKPTFKEKNYSFVRIKRILYFKRLSTYL